MDEIDTSVTDGCNVNCWRFWCIVLGFEAGVEVDAAAISFRRFMLKFVELASDDAETRDILPTSAGFASLTLELQLVKYNEGRTESMLIIEDQQWSSNYDTPHGGTKLQ